MYEARPKLEGSTEDRAGRWPQPKFVRCVCKTVRRPSHQPRVIKAGWARFISFQSMKRQSERGQQQQRPPSLVDSPADRRDQRPPKRPAANAPRSMPPVYECEVRRSIPMSLSRIDGWVDYHVRPCPPQFLALAVPLPLKMGSWRRDPASSLFQNQLQHTSASFERLPVRR